MNRHDLVNHLKRHTPADADEADSLAKTIAFIESEPQAFERRLQKGHVTGSALLAGPDGKVLLMHHKALDKWLQFGGHADGDENILRVAIREAEEESGIGDLTLLSDGIADVDIHMIPDRPAKNEPAHLHYDIRFILCTGKTDFTLDDDGVTALEWCDYATAEKRLQDAATKRLLNKWRALAAA